MDKLQGLLVGSCGQYVKAAGSVKSFGSFFFLRCQKMACGLPDFLLLESIDSGCRIPFLIVPDGLDFYKNKGLAVACDDIEFATLIGVVSSENLVTLAAKVRRGLRLDKVPLGLVVH